MTAEQKRQARREAVARKMQEIIKRNAIIRGLYRREPFVKAGSK